MTSLYEAGWRQGSILAATLPLDSVVLDSDGRSCRSQQAHDIWAVATQECDLDRTDEWDPEPSIELRPVYTVDPPQHWGIRSAEYRLTETDHVISRSPRTVVSAQVLSALLAAGATWRTVT